MKQHKRLLAILLALVMVLALAACGGGNNNAAEPTEAPAEEKTEESSENTEEATVPDEADKAEEGEETEETEEGGDAAEGAPEETGKLVIYAGALEDECIAIGEAFEEETGIDTEVVVLGGGEILARVEAESANPIASVWWGGGIDGQMNAKDRGLLQPYISPNAEFVDDSLKDPEGYWTGVYTGYVGFVYNIEKLEELGVDVPDSWDDLLDPKLEGEIEFAAPNASSTGYNVVATLIEAFGEDEGLEKAAALDKNAIYGERGTCWIAPVTSGEVAIGLCFLQDAIDLMVNEGYGDVIGISTPSEGTGYELGGVAIINNCPDLASAQKFVDWCLTAEAQEIDQQYGHYVFLTNKDAHNPEQAEVLKDTKLVDRDFLHIAEMKEEWLGRWEELTGNT